MGKTDNRPNGKEPWNEPKQGEAYFPCAVTETLIKKHVQVTTKMYDVETEVNEDGLDETFVTPCKEVDWGKEYETNNITIQDMLKELKTYVESDLSMTGKNTSKGKYLQRLLDACQGWGTYDIEVDYLSWMNTKVS